LFITLEEKRMRFSLIKPSTSRYRADIDGLRAVAVLLVFAYHLGTARVKGGFIGVDVFFVISGYLIGSIILTEIGACRFSLMTFYERRVRRIVPALFVTLAVSAILAYRFFLPAEMDEFAKSLLAATFSFSNILFYHQSGYFEGAASMKPLLHTWSLAVEEQFYIFLPLFLMALRRFTAARQRVWILVAALVSFFMSVWGAFHSPEATFYLAHTRAWELLLGTLIALDLFPRFSNVILRNAASLAGIVAIMATAILYDKTTPFPGLAASVPCLGAALIIAAGRGGASLVGRALSLRPVVFVGTISYSLYLWHWPLVVFQGASGVLAQGLSPKSAKLVVLGVSFVVATLSWRFVEQPFRESRNRLPRPRLFKLASAAAVILTIFGAAALATQGFPLRYPSEAVRIASYLENADPTTEAEYRVGTCFLTSRNPHAGFNRNDCLKSVPGERNELLIGDSHAAQLWFGLSTIFKDINFMQATASGCKPTLEQPIGANQRCKQLMDYVLHDYLRDHPVDSVLLAARWEGSDLPRLERTVLWLKKQGIKVVLFGPVVQYDSALPRLLAISIQQNDPQIPADHRVAYYEKLDNEMAQLARDPLNVRYISYFKLICQERTCVEYASKGVPLQSDYGHLTGDGSVLIASKIREREGFN
jgi:peptidoglycan/LPS O-acetylase OafA/YrhL